MKERGASMEREDASEVRRGAKAVRSHSVLEGASYWTEAEAGLNFFLGIYKVELSWIII